MQLKVTPVKAVPAATIEAARLASQCSGTCQQTVPTQSDCLKHEGVLRSLAGEGGRGCSR